MMNKRQLATVLAGLRLVQKLSAEELEDVQDVLTEGGTLDALNNDEIDELCETLNVGDDSPKVSLRLELTVDYTTEDGSMSESELENEGRELLEALGERAASEGLLSGDSEMVASKWSTSIKRV